MPRRALAFLSGTARRGAAGMPHFARRTGMSFLANPDKNDGAQEASGIGSPFLWILSFGEAKESISPVGARTHIQLTVALATPFYPLILITYLLIINLRIGESRSIKSFGGTIGAFYFIVH
jgi:hypothetical protein